GEPPRPHEAIRATILRTSHPRALSCPRMHSDVAGRSSLARDHTMSGEGSAQTARLSTFAALRGRNYRFYWLGLVLYVLGHRAEYVTFAWITWEVAKSPLALGYLGLAQGAPMVVFQLFGGVLADRTNRLRLLLATQILTALNLTAAFVLTISGLARLEH